ncbi:Hypothetical protein GLP15_603 [Giardia lamblia P15]|uniref:Uncharacterized protein n=1 Tax=Giardia intestinalis (strain P15) TaxID=658858 RepID=E1F570_GIAIA|nr:Hypothetical protein GLP15_603 [Giardia lamblia P15]
MFNFGTNSSSTLNVNQDIKQPGNLSFGNLNLSTGDSQGFSVFSSCMPTLDMVFKRDNVQPANNHLVDSNLMFDFRQPKVNNLPAQPPMTTLTMSSDSAFPASPGPQPPHVSESFSDPANLTDYISKYAQTVGSSLSTTVVKREICTNPIIKKYSHSLISSDNSHVYGLLNTSTGAILLTVNVAHGNQASKQELNITDYITDILVDPFDDNLVLFSQSSMTVYILNRFTGQVINSYPHTLSYYSYFSQLYKKTYLFLLMPNEAIAGIAIYILDLKTQKLHQCPVPIFTFEFLDREVCRLTDNKTYSFSSTDVTRAYICPFGASTDCLDASLLNQPPQPQSFLFEESVFYVGLELLLPSNKVALVHSMVGPLLLEPVKQRVASLSKIKASDSIKMISSDNFSVDFYLVQQIQSLIISDEEPRYLIDIIPVAVCSIDDDVYSHFFLCMSWASKQTSTSLYELCGAESFLYECNNPITISIQDALFSYKDETICIHRVMAFRNHFNTSGGAQMLLLGIKTIEDTLHEFMVIVFNVANASLEQTAVTIQGDFPVLLGYDPIHHFILCASGTFSSISILHMTSQPPINYDPLAFSHSTTQISKSSLQQVTNWLSRFSTKKFFEDSLIYLKSTPVAQIDPDTLNAKLISLNEAIVAVLSHSFPGESSLIKTLLKTTEGLLKQIFKNNNLLLQAMQQINMNLVQLSSECISNSSTVVTTNSNDDTISSYL